MCGEIPGTTQHKLSKIGILKAVIPSYNTEINKKIQQQNVSKHWLSAASTILSSVNNTNTYHQDLAILQEILNGIYIAIQNNSKINTSEDVSNPITAHQLESNYYQIWNTAQNTADAWNTADTHNAYNAQFLCGKKQQIQELLGNALTCLNKKITQAKAQFKILHSKHLSPAAIHILEQYLHSGALKWLVAMADDNYRRYLGTYYTQKISSVFENQRYNSAVKLEVTKTLLMIVLNHIFVYNSIFKYTATNDR
jgi:hypothetical protein